MKKVLIFSIFSGILILSYSFICSNDIKNLSASLIGNDKEFQPEISIIFTGDIMLDRGVEYKIEQHDNELNWPFNLLEMKADLIVGNLEGQISDKGVNVGTIYSFRVNPGMINPLKEAGFNILNVNNNHFNDYTQTAFLDCLERLKENNIDYFGGGKNEEEAFSSLIKEINGTKIAFLSYMDLGTSYWRAQEDKAGIAWIEEADLEKISQDIKKAKKEADILIVSMHSGTEYSQEISSFQEKLAKIAIDNGADLVIGHHPHVVQKYEEYKGKYIFYSLGNFIFDQSFSEETMTGMIVKITIQDKEIKEIYTQESKQNTEYQVYLTDKIEKIF